MSSLTSLCPVDVPEFNGYFTDFGTTRHRLNAMRNWFHFVLDPEGWSGPGSFQLANSEYKKIKEYEELTNHDVKAMEYYIRRGCVEESSKELVHIGCTSEDVCSLGLATALDGALLHFGPHIDLGDPEIMVKWGGAVGNHSALAEAFDNPEAMADEFIEEYGFTRVPYTTQVDPMDWLVAILQKIFRANAKLPDADWRKIMVQPLLSHLIVHLPTSRLQRDLSNSTRLRNLGLALALSLDMHRVPPAPRCPEITAPPPRARRCGPSGHPGR